MLESYFWVGSLRIATLECTEECIIIAVLESHHANAEFKGGDNILAVCNGLRETIAVRESNFWPRNALL